MSSVHYSKMSLPNRAVMAVLGPLASVGLRTTGQATCNGLQSMTYCSICQQPVRIS